MYAQKHGHPSQAVPPPGIKSGNGLPMAKDRMPHGRGPLDSP